MNITVCDKCMCASCFNGIFYCEDYKQAGVVEVDAKELRKLNREHPSYYCEVTE